MANRTMLAVLIVLVIGALAVTNHMMSSSIPGSNSPSMHEGSLINEADNININKGSSNPSYLSYSHSASERSSSSSHQTSQSSSQSQSSSSSSPSSSSPEQNQNKQSFMAGAISGQEYGMITLEEAKQKGLEVKK